MTKALFLDRDGIINVDKGYLYKAEDVEFVDGIFDLCRLAAEKGFLLIVITNQAGIARGLYGHEDVEKLHNWLKKRFDDAEAPLAAVYYCPHHPDFSGPCSCRKPAPGMIDDAVRDFDIDRSASVMVGDKPSDVQAGKNAGLGFCILVSSKYTDGKPDEADVMVHSVKDVAEFIK